MGLTIGVLGASGGVGASTLTAALAGRAQAVIDGCDVSVAVDLDVRGGLDTTLCIEHLEGLRWPDLELRGWLESAPLREPAAGDLPGESGVHVLAGTGERLPETMLVLETVDALASATDLLAVDCGPRPVDALLSRLDLLVVVARLSAKGAADASALSRACPLARTRTVLVTRGPAGDRSGSALARELGIPWLAHLADDLRVPRQAAEGLPPGAVRSGVDGVADEALIVAQSTWLHTMMGRLDDAGRSA